MALVVLLRGVNVGGHKIFRPSILAKQLKHLDAVNIGAAGTFVIRKSVSQARLRSELARRLPFETKVIICEGKDILGLMSRDPFAGQLAGPDIVRFVSVLSKLPSSEPTMPVTFPSNGKWLLRIFGRKGRFVLGMYRRHMKTIGYLGETDRLFDVPVTTRNWNTIAVIAKVLAPKPP